MKEIRINEYHYGVNKGKIRKMGFSDEGRRSRIEVQCRYLVGTVSQKDVLDGYQVAIDNVDTEVVKKKGYIGGFGQVSLIHEGVDQFLIWRQICEIGYPKNAVLVVCENREYYVKPDEYSTLYDTLGKPKNIGVTFYDSGKQFVKFFGDGTYALLSDSENELMTMAVIAQAKKYLDCMNINFKAIL